MLNGMLKEMSERANCKKMSMNAARSASALRRLESDSRKNLRRNEETSLSRQRRRDDSGKWYLSER